MDSIKKLYMEFLDEDSQVYTLILSNPRSDLTLAEVTDVMEGIISDGVLVTPKGKTLDSVSNCYYRVVSKIALTNPGGGE